MAGETRLCCGAERWGPTLTRGDRVGRENTPSQNRDAIEDASEAAGAGGLFLPPYAPELNPLARCWSKLNSGLRARNPRTFPDSLEV